MIEIIGKNKVRVSRYGIREFNRMFPCSTLRDTRSYWFEFDDNENLIDTDCPEQDDGPAATAISQDCQEFLFRDIDPAWSQF